MKRSQSERGGLPGFWIILGLGLTGILGTVLVLVSLTAARPAAPGPSTPILSSSTSPTPQPTPPPTAFDPTDSEGTQQIRPPTPTPAPRPEVPEVAPDFTLDRADGGTFTLSQQLEEGPVVLVFFQRCG